MGEIENRASEFYSKYMVSGSSSSREEYHVALEALPDDVRQAVSAVHYGKKRESVSQYYISANAGASHDELSDSGKYTLRITRYSTKPGYSGYSQGLVFLTSDMTKPLFEVQRNYGRFPFLFIEGHENGHDYLVCGEDYQGQTVLELDTGARKDYVPIGIMSGHGFCWGSMNWSSKEQVLIVSGCIWACPYEYRFYDFSDPLNKLTSMDVFDKNGKETCIDDNNIAPQFESGLLKCFDTRLDEENNDDDTEDDVYKVVADTTYRRDGDKFVYVSARVDADEEVKRAESVERCRKYDEWLANFRATDPLYTKMTELRATLPAQVGHRGVGVCYKGWCPFFELEERRFCSRLYYQHGDSKSTVDLEWAHETGPVKLDLFSGGNHIGSKFFHEHSVKSIEDAYQFAKDFVCGNVVDGILPKAQATNPVTVG